MACRECGRDYEKVDMYYIPRYDAHVCEECFDEYYRQCDSCGEYINKSEAYETIDDEYVCEDCVSEYYICEDCGRAVNEYDIREVNLVGYVCINCIDNYGYCDHCEEYYPSHYMNYAENISICDNCIDDYVRCISCEDLIHIDNAYLDEDDEEYYCRHCYWE